MGSKSSDENLYWLNSKLMCLWDDPHERSLLARTVRALNVRYKLDDKITREPAVEEIIAQIFGRLAIAIVKLSNLRGKKVLDIACGSNTSKAPASIYIDTPFGEMTLGNPAKGYTAMFEPWFCRILFELNAVPVGVDFGDLDREIFTHYQLDLGQMGALDFLPDHSFDAVQDSRLFGSPEFTSQFPKPMDRLRVAREIIRQETRLLKDTGIIIHSDAQELLS